MEKKTCDTPVSSSTERPADAAKTGKNRTIQKSAKRIRLEKEFAAAYEAYMHPAAPLSAFRQHELLGQLHVLLFDLTEGWAVEKTRRYLSAGFLEADDILARSRGCDAAFQVLKQDHKTGTYRTSPVAFYVRVTKNKIIDLYFRKEFGRLPSEKKGDPDDSQKEQEDPKKRKRPYQVSLNALSMDSDGIYHDDRNKALACNPFADTRRPHWEIADKSHQMSVLFLRELMDYPFEPQKPLALMYGNILFQLAKESEEKSELNEIARKSSKVSSPSWAHQAMGNMTLEQLGNLSERIIQQRCAEKLAWGIPFRDHMPQPINSDSDLTWREIVYTDMYTVANTSNWIESIQQSTMMKCAARLVADPDLLEFAEDSFEPTDKLMKAIDRIAKKKKKEVSR